MRKVNVLLVEDNPGDVRLTQEALKIANVPGNLFVVSDGVEAMTYLRSEGKYAQAVAPDIVLLDLNEKQMRQLESWIFCLSNGIDGDWIKDELKQDYYGGTGE